MIKQLKSNKIISLLLIIMCFFVLFNPTIYAKACLNGISVWSLKILPLLFPFFVITRMIVTINSFQINIMEKFFNKVYLSPIGSFNAFFLSALSGYPMGAKLICLMHENGQADTTEAEKMLSFCSVSGPMFMLGTVGVMMLNSKIAGLIILISNIIASLLNGLIYRGKPLPAKRDLKIYNKNSFSLSDCVYDSLISILMVGAYVVLSFFIIQIFSSLCIFDFATNTLCSVFSLDNSHNIVRSILVGCIEMTAGILQLSSINISLCAKTIIASGLVSFGGLSIFLQSLNFLSKLNIKPKTMLKQKLTQTILTLIISIPLSLIFL